MPDEDQFMRRILAWETVGGLVGSSLAAVAVVRTDLPIALKVLIGGSCSLIGLGIGVWIGIANSPRPD